MNAELGQVIDGKYRLIRLLGSGGMGAVYEGENLRIRRRVAIKMLHSSVSTQQESVTRFEREAQAAGRIGSEHICEVLDLGVLPDSTRYMVMEYLEGETMSSRIKRFGRLTPAQATPLLLQVLAGLEAAHAAGIIHRDLKPDNVWIVPQKGGMRDFVKVLDFGVSKFSQIGGEEMNTTRAGAVVGTPYYMSPEQARGMGSIDARTDIYAIGVLLYQAATGQVPYQAETFNELLFKIVLEVAPPPQTYVPDMDPDFVAIIQKAMAREPQQRYQTCGEFRDALCHFQASRPAQGALPPLRPPPTMDPALQRGQGQPQAWQGQPQHPHLSASQPGYPGMRVMQQQTQALDPAGMRSYPGLSSSAILVGASGPTPPPMATSNAWGNASMGGAQPARSKAGIFVALGGILVLGGLVAAGVALKTGTGSAPGSGGTASPAEPTPSATGPAATATPVVAESATPAAPATAAPAATASAQPSAAEPTVDGPGEPASAAPTPAARNAGKPRTFGPMPKPAAPKPAAPAAPTPPPKPAAGDLGY